MMRPKKYSKDCANDLQNVRCLAKVVKNCNSHIADGRFSGFCIDSRTIKKSNVFIAIKGKRLDGHRYIGEAFKRGASVAIAEKNTGFPKKYKDRILLVDDTRYALRAIAGHHRARFRLPVIAVTGSCGKTTVKEILAFLLKDKFSVLKSVASYNNQIGIPLTLLKIKPSHTICVVELGTNTKGEINRLRQICRPDTVILTNIAESHLAGFGSKAQVYKEKISAIKKAGKNQVCFINADDEYLRKIPAGIKKITFGINTNADYKAVNVTTGLNKTSFLLGKHKICSSLNGTHNVYNILAAVACARNYGIKWDRIEDIIRKYRNPCRNRFNVRMSAGRVIINDAYNANPYSFTKSVETLTRLFPKKRKIVVAGDMLELGKKSDAYHKKLGMFIANSGIDKLFTVGKKARFISEGAVQAGMPCYNAVHYRNKKKLTEKIFSDFHENNVILFKGSHSTGLSQTCEKIEKRISRGNK